MRHKLAGLKQAAFLPTLLVVVPPSIIGFLIANNFSVGMLLLLILAVALWDISANVLNNYADWEIDVKNGKRQKMHMHISKNELLAAFAGFLLGSFAVIVLLLRPSAYFYVFYGLEVLLAVWYSMHVTLKDKLVVNYAAIALAYGLFSFLMGYFAVGSSLQGMLYSLPVGLFLGLLYFGITIVKDYGDIEGDRAHNKKTLPIHIGKGRTLSVQYTVISIAYALLLLFIALGVVSPVLLISLPFYFTVMLMLSQISKTSDPTRLRNISFYTQINTFFMGIAIMLVLLL